jgi:hypothetical protein
MVGEPIAHCFFEEKSHHTTQACPETEDLCQQLVYPLSNEISAEASKDLSKYDPEVKYNTKG